MESLVCYNSSSAVWLNTIPETSFNKCPKYIFLLPDTFCADTKQHSIPKNILGSQKKLCTSLWLRSVASYHRKTQKMSVYIHRKFLNWLTKPNLLKILLFYFSFLSAYPFDYKMSLQLFEGWRPSLSIKGGKGLLLHKKVVSYPIMSKIYFKIIRQ